jgi:hypothetical protein
MTAITVPDVAETLLGFRAWRWQAPSSLLSVTRGSVPKRQPRTRALLATPDGAWPNDGPLDAVCGKGHPAPDADCACGLYAAYKIDVIAEYVRDAPILGLVQGFGTTVPGDDGFRAEHMTIAALFAVAPEFGIPRQDLDQLADHYHVRVVVPHSATPEDYRMGVRSGFADGWQLDFEGGGVVTGPINPDTPVVQVEQPCPATRHNRMGGGPTP